MRSPLLTSAPSSASSGPKRGKQNAKKNWAYSLLGIFGVFIPTIYGEGKENATRRLRKEIASEGQTQPFPADTRHGRQEERRVFDVPLAVNKNYVSRPGLLQQLLNSLRPGRDGSPRVALWGLGGSGKTQLTLQFVVQHHTSYLFVFWLNGDSWAQLLAGFAHMLRLAGVTHTVGSNEADAASEWLLANTGWLLVVDNLDDSTALHRLHEEVLRASMKGSILVTSRNDEVALQRYTIEVSTMTREESTALVEVIAGSDRAKEEATMALLNDLGDLPLAIDQAASYMRAADLTVADYCVLYNKVKSRYLRIYPSARYNVSGRQSVMTTWDISFSEVLRSHPPAATLLLLLSLLRSEDIPISIFKSCISGQYLWGPSGDFEKVHNGQG